MRTLANILLGAGMLLAAGTAAAGDVTVSFQKPEQYSDLAWNAKDREDLLQELQEHLVRLGTKLPADSRLQVDVLDVDLAGHIHHGRFGQDIRVLRGTADWPTMQLHYRLESHGQVVAEGSDHLANMDYLNRLNIYSSGDPLRYEKQMIDGWFKDRFLAHK